LRRVFVAHGALPALDQPIPLGHDRQGLVPPTGDFREAADVAAIRAIVEPFERPPRSFDAVDWENAFGGRRKGAADLTKFLTERVRPTMTGMKIAVEEVRLTTVTPDVVVADKHQMLSGQTDGPGGKVLPDRHVRQG